ncbi:MAG: diguanylate cyclase [Candidatus Accumulibacter sp.]|jgi:diguanylate cyclase (GGDEF)-like protein|nr:diguanylate cyclase [Accumulibacter sp.]
MNKEAFTDSAVDTLAGKRRILVVDGSRVVRTTLAKRLEDSFGVVEEDNGESAWQRLMLDSSIVAVIVSINPPRLSAHDLLERMRASALRRLRETPVVLLASDDSHETGAEDWQRQWVAGFMTKSMTREAMAERLEEVLSVPYQASRIEPPEDPPEALPEAPREEKLPEAQDKPLEIMLEEIEIQEETGKEKEEAREKTRVSRAVSFANLLEEDAFVAAVASLPHELGSEESLCVLVFGIDRLNELVGRFGADVPDLLNGQIAKLLAAKIDRRDVLGRCGENRVAIVSHGVDLRTGMRFGKRVCKSMATGRIAVHGRKVRLTTSVGVAATSDERMASPEALLALAQERLRQAMICGGNSVCIEIRPDCPLAQRDKALSGLFGLLGEVLEPEQKEALGMAVQPLLRKIDAKAAIEARRALGLPATDEERPAPGGRQAQETS